MTNNFTLFCLVDGDSLAGSFNVELPSSSLVSHLRRLIKLEKPNDFGNIDADNLKLWHAPVTINDIESPIFLDNLIEKDLLAPRRLLSDVFPPGSLNASTFIIVQPPPTVLQNTGLVSEREFVLHVLPNITATEPQTEMSTDTTRRYSQPPASVALWPNFLRDVCRLDLATQTIYPSPSFRHVRGFTTEGNLQELFLQDVGSVRSIPPYADTISSTGLQYGKPDLVCTRHNEPNSTLFPVEIKKPAYLELRDGTSYPTAYPEGGLAIQGPLNQIYGYMRWNGFRYGVLSTYTQTWFIKRLQEHEHDILISPTIQFNQTQPTLLQCYLWFIKQADRDQQWQPDSPDLTMLDTLGQAQPAARNIASPYFSFGLKLSRGVQRWIRHRARGLSSVTERELISIPAFKNLKLVAQGEAARTFRASWGKENVVVKKADVWNQRQVVHELEHEERVYRVLQKLQGQCIPRMKTAGIANGMEMILVTEFMGTDLRDEHLDSSDRDMIRAALSAIHNLGVLHGDIRPHNIVVQRRDQKSQFFFIDFGLSKFAKVKSFLDREAEELESMLGRMPWPEASNPEIGAKPSL